MFVPICKSFRTKTISYFLRNICLLFRPHGPSKGSKSRRPRINYLKHGLSTRRYCNFDNSFYLCTYLQFISPVIFHAKNVGKRNLASMMLRKCDLFSKQYFLSSETRFHGSLTRWEIAALEERLVRGGGGGGGGGEGGGEAALSHAVDRHEGPPPPPPPHIRIREIQFKDFRGFYWESKKYKILRRASFLSNM